MIKKILAINSSNITHKIINVNSKDLKVYSADFTDIFTNRPPKVLIEKV